MRVVLRWSISAATAALVAAVALSEPAFATPRAGEPGAVPSPAAPTSTPTVLPAREPEAASDATDPLDAPAAGTGGSGTAASPFAPAPNLKKNPIDVLPPDVVYPPLDPTPRKPILWNPEWPRFGAADWAITGAGAAIAVAAAIVPPQSKHVYGGFAFDESARRSLRLPTTEGRYIARDASDVVLSLEATWPFFIDALVTTWWYRGSPDAAAQMALVDGEALAIVTALQGATNTLVSRERPYGKICNTPEQPGQTTDCEGNVRYRSFFSGHTAFTFMAAGLICVHHMELDLLRGAGDPLACVTAYAGAAATGTLRVMGDMHYVSDVLVGAGIGTLVGLAVPLLHYRHVNLAPGDKHGVDVRLMPVGSGVGLGGTF
jgi:membrane-associated phospholipid phosphatase